MLSYNLIHLVQYHADNLAASLLRRAEMSKRAESYRNVSAVDLKERVYEIYHHLGTWLVDKRETRYRATLHGDWLPSRRARCPSRRTCLGHSFDKAHSVRIHRRSVLSGTCGGRISEAGIIGAIRPIFRPSDSCCCCRLRMRG